ncbi:MAG TPA: penicillin-binding protein 2 [Candidatus Bathyarchaeia archaeon]|nr:penicillin-binding protein 2 [Candidatus Bathyarchaeia archaeon]
MNPSTSIKRRSFMILLLLTLLWTGLVARLWWIQLGSPHHFSAHGVDLIKNAVQQRRQSIVLHTGRGDILDRHGHPLTGVEQKALLLFPLAKASVDEAKLQEVAAIIHEPRSLLERTLQEVKEPVMLRDADKKLIALTDQQADAVNRLQIPGLLALPVTERYRPDGVAKHVVGYVSQNPEYVKSVYEEEWKSGKLGLDTMVGAAGLERSFERFLQGVEPSTLSYYVDGHGAPLRGLDVRYSKQEQTLYPLSLVTTLDADIQESVERIADESHLHSGSIVVLDAKTGDVVSMVSRPLFDQTKVDVTRGEWQNHALKQIPPGSVFKTVVAAAALGEGIVSPTDRFECEGEYGKYGFSCWKKEGHGTLTMEEAFAESCNIAFAEIAKRVGGEKIEEYAKKLGVSSQVGHVSPQLFKLTDFRQFTGEDKGRVFAEGSSRSDEGILIQTAIGQRDVRMTPLQAANLMVTILNDGNPRSVRIVDQITYKNGLSFAHFSPQELQEDGIDALTAYKLKRMMRKVVTDGTGMALTDEIWTVAGKSGTAQVDTSNEQMAHHWFVGYTPVEEPRYAIAVVVENQPANRLHQATSVFGRVVEALAAQSAKPALSRAGNSPE